MHYSVLVIVPDNCENKEDARSFVEKMLAPHEGIHFDWFQIGGRWTGSLDGYDPYKDPANIEPCRCCNATGKRKDMEIPDGCNGCRGTGKAPVWPTEFVEHDGDVQLVKNIKDGFYPYAFVLPNVAWKAKGEKWIEINGQWRNTLEDKWIPQAKKILSKYKDHYAVIVDCHN